METIISYLKWRGDLSLAEYPFNGVDNLILSELAYLDLGGIVPAFNEPGEIGLKDALLLFLHMEQKLVDLDEKRKNFAQLLRESRRYERMTLRNYVHMVSPDGKEPALTAMEIRFGGDSSYIAFRGDGESLLSWRDGFTMSYQVMPAQLYALQYVNRIYDAEIEKYYFGGHGTGGCLALYAAANCDEEQQNKLVYIFGNDSPGASEEVIGTEKLDRIGARVVRIVPEFSILGDLFPVGGETVIVKSMAKGLLQHDPFSWGIEGDHFDTVPKFCRESQFYHDVLRNWVENADTAARMQFTGELFDALESNGICTLDDLSENGVDEFLVILISLSQAKQPDRDIVQEFGQIFISGVRWMSPRLFFREWGTIAAILLAAVGLWIGLNPAFAAQFAGVAAGIAATLYTGRQLLVVSVSDRGPIPAKKTKIVGLMVVMWILMYLVAEQSLLVRLSNLLIGAGFLLFAYYWLNRAFRYRKIFPKRIIACLISGAFFVIGTLPIVARNLSLENYMVGAGILLWLYGLGALVIRVYQKGKNSVPLV